MLGYKPPSQQNFIPVILMSDRSNVKSQLNQPRLMVVEDQASMRELLQEYLEQQGFCVDCFPSAEAALRELGLGPTDEGAEFNFSESTRKPDSGGELPSSSSPKSYDAVLTDIKMPGLDGLRFCQMLGEYRANLPVIVMTAYGSMETSVEALRAGAFDFVTKPVELELLKASLLRATEHARLKQQVRSLKAHTRLNQFDQLIGDSEVIRKLKDQLSRVVNSSASVLLTGESGSGKEVAARALHSQSERAEKPFVAVNCAALPESLIESELFGHVKGAFTDARQDRDGLFLQADGGTLFLDEIGELPIEMQPKLLRCLEQKTVRPGAARPNSPLTFASSRQPIGIWKMKLRRNGFARISTTESMFWKSPSPRCEPAEPTCSCWPSTSSTTSPHKPVVRFVNSTRTLLENYWRTTGPAMFAN